MESTPNWHSVFDMDLQLLDYSNIDSGWREAGPLPSARFIFHSDLESCINNHCTESPSARYGLAGTNLEEVTGRSKQCQKRTVAGVPRERRLELECKVHRYPRLGPGGRAMGSGWPAFYPKVMKDNNG